MQAIKTNGRTPPQAVDVEKQVLGAILLEPDVFADVTSTLTAGDFYDSKHRQIYESITNLYQSGHPIDLVSVTNHLRRQDALGDVGGAEYLTDLTAEVGTTENAGYHCQIVAEKAILRGMIKRLTRMTQEAYEPNADAFELMDEAMAELLEIRQRPSGTVYTSEDLAEGITGLLDGGKQDLFVPTGFPVLDRRIDGLHVGRLQILSARTNHGKSATADQIALNVGKRWEDKRVLKFDMENSDSEKHVRLAANLSGVNAQKIQRHAQGKRTLGDQEIADVRSAAKRLQKLPITIDTSSSVDAEYIRARLQAEQSRGEVGLVIVDDIGNMHAPGADGPRDQASRSIIGLHHLAKDEDVPVLAINQINRQALSGANGYPHLHHLKWTGAAEEKTAMVMMLHHDLAHWEATERTQGKRPDPNTLRVFVRKNKGPQGEVALHFDKDTLRIKDPNDEAPF